MNTFFVSDTHFGHTNIIKYCKRPYASVEEMNQKLEENWNAIVRKEDLVYHLGDVAFHNFEIIPRLNGRIKLVPGNHDLERAKKVLHLFDEVLPELTYLKLSLERRFVLCHYPIESWRREYRYHLHGHAHGTSVQRPWRMDVGIDATGVMAPMHVDDVIQSLLSNHESTT